MSYQAYATTIDIYQMPGGFSLERADNKEFIKAWAVYRQVNEDFAQSLAEVQQELARVKFCFWIKRNGRRLGGVVMLPRNIGDFYLFPPKINPVLVVSNLMPLLTHWSGVDNSITAQAISSHYLEAFQQAGFRLVESRVWMIRPTEPMEVEWTEKWQVIPLNPEQAEHIASLLKEAFRGGVSQYGEKDLAGHLASVKRFFEGFQQDSIFGRSSALVRERASGKLAGVCMVGMHKGLPAVTFVAVAPEFRRQGIASNLMKQAINQLSTQYDWVKLAVTLENPAVSLYRNLGFVIGDALHRLIRAPGN